jgi:hypothetical protein
MVICRRGSEMVYGVLYSTDNRRIGVYKDSMPDFKESWLAKLGSWTEVLAVYEDKLRHTPDDFDAILGSMRCLDTRPPLINDVSADCLLWQQSVQSA